jgi:2Fe-2S ferredoxin
MPKITFIDPDGVSYTVEAEIGATVMETAMRNEVPGIIASCGGSCACATCHVHVDEAWMALVGERSGEEEDMLDSAIDVGPTSRLSCQILVVEELDGLKVTVAAQQI